MFDLFDGLPLHVLVVHAAVVFTPLAALSAVVFAAVSSWRWWLRWPMVALSLLALGLVFLAVQSGKAFRDRLLKLGYPRGFITVHQQDGQLLLWFLVAFALIVAASAYALGGPSALRSGRGARAGLSGGLRVVVALVLVVAALGVGFQVVRTGEAGARAVYAPVSG
jgi:hypothetical protein